MKIENNQQAFDRLLSVMTDELTSKDHRTSSSHLYPEKVFLNAVRIISIESTANKKAIDKLMKAEDDTEALFFKLLSKIKKHK
jgi:hypothetical protein